MQTAYPGGSHGHGVGLLHGQPTRNSSAHVHNQHRERGQGTGRDRPPSALAWSVAADPWWRRRHHRAPLRRWLARSFPCHRTACSALAQPSSSQARSVFSAWACHTLRHWLGIALRAWQPRWQRMCWRQRVSIVPAAAEPAAPRRVRWQRCCCWQKYVHGRACLPWRPLPRGRPRPWSCVSSSALGHLFPAPPRGLGQAWSPRRRDTFPRRCRTEPAHSRGPTEPPGCRGEALGDEKQGSPRVPTLPGWAPAAATARAVAAGRRPLPCGRECGREFGREFGRPWPQ